MSTGTETGEGSAGRIAPDDNEGYAVGWDQDTILWGNIPPRQDIATGNSWGWGKKRFGAMHPDGFNVAMADGHTEFLSYSLSPQVFSLLCSIGDGEPVALDERRANGTSKGGYWLRGRLMLGGRGRP